MERQINTGNQAFFLRVQRFTSIQINYHFLYGFDCRRNPGGIQAIDSVHWISRDTLLSFHNLDNLIWVSCQWDQDSIASSLEPPQHFFSAGDLLQELFNNTINGKKKHLNII